MCAALSHQVAPPPLFTAANRRPNENFFSLLLLVLALVILIAGRAYAPAPIRHWFDNAPLQKARDGWLLPAAALLAMLLHEAGHLLAAFALGFRILGGSLGPLRLQILHRTWKISLSPRNLFTASVSAVPGNLKNWRPAMMFVVAAGPLMTLGSIFVAAALPVSARSALLFQLLFVQISLLLLLLGLLPTTRNARVHNDSRLLLDLALQNQGAEEIELNVLLTQQVLSGIRPQDYPDTLLKRLAAWRGRPESQLLFGQALVRWALDSEEFDLADAWDARTLLLAEHCGRQMQNNTLAVSACFDVLFRRDTQSAIAQFSRVNFGNLFPKSFELRSRAAYEFARGHNDRVAPLIIRAQYALPPGVPAYNLDRMLLERLHMKVLATSKAAADVRYRTASA